MSGSRIIRDTTSVDSIQVIFVLEWISSLQKCRVYHQATRLVLSVHASNQKAEVVNDSAHQVKANFYTLSTSGRNMNMPFLCKFSDQVVVCIVDGKEKSVMPLCR